MFDLYAEMLDLYDEKPMLDLYVPGSLCVFMLEVAGACVWSLCWQVPMFDLMLAVAGAAFDLYAKKPMFDLYGQVILLYLDADRRLYVWSLCRQVYACSL
jgi:hypothetical protein